MDVVQLANWYAGHDRNLVEAFRVFDPLVVRALGVENGAVVWLSDYTLTKNQIFHKKINFQDYQRLPDILSAGFVLTGNKKCSVQIVHADLSENHFKFWCVGLKGTTLGEVFVSMFHRGNLKDVRRLYRRGHRKGTLLRDHKEAPVRHLLGHTSANA